MAEKRKGGQKPSPAQEKLDAVGDDAVIGWIAEGKTQDEIAEEVGVSAGTLNKWLHAEDERSARARGAMSVSAETWLDRGYKALLEAPPEASEIARARAIEQHCARRAAIRDPRRYGDKLALGGAEDLPPLKSMPDDALQAKIAALTAKVNGKQS